MNLSALFLIVILSGCAGGSWVDDGSGWVRQDGPVVDEEARITFDMRSPSYYGTSGNSGKDADAAVVMLAVVVAESSANAINQKRLWEQIASDLADHPKIRLLAYRESERVADWGSHPIMRNRALLSARQTSHADAVALVRATVRQSAGVNREGRVQNFAEIALTIDMHETWDNSKTQQQLRGQVFGMATNKELGEPIKAWVSDTVVPRLSEESRTLSSRRR